MSRTLTLALTVLLCAASTRAARFGVIVEGQSPETAALVKALREAGGTGHEGALFDMSASELSDPIEKGKFVARLARSELLVPVGEGATRFALREFEDTPAFFVGAAVVEGSFLAAPNVAGILALDGAGVLEAASFLGLKRLGLAYTPGYAPLSERLAALAETAGISLQKTKVESARAVIPAIQKLFPKVDAVWILGDPLLSRGAGFEFLIELSLSRKTPVIAPTPWEVERGALFCLKVDFASLQAPAAAGLKRILESGLKLPARRLETAAGGAVVFNRGLMKRWGLSPPKGGRWQASP